MIPRRGYLKTGGAIFGGLILLGAISLETEYLGDSEGDENGEDSNPSDEEGDADTSEESTEETTSRDVLYDTTVEDRLEEEHEFSSGDVLYVEASINHDGRGVFTLNVGPGEELRKTDIEDDRSFSQEIEHDGTHIVNAIAGGGPEGQMELRVEIERVER